MTGLLISCAQIASVAFANMNITKPVFCCQNRFLHTVFFDIHMVSIQMQIGIGAIDILDLFVQYLF